MEHQREPMWYCHECHAEMRPLMVPDPTCASCHGSFVEKIENSSDDPREYTHNAAVDGAEGIPAGMDFLMSALQTVMQPQRRATFPNPDGPPRQRPFSVSLSTAGSGGHRTIHIGPRRDVDRPPTMSEFTRRGPEGDGDGIAGSLMTQYLMALLNGSDRAGAAPALLSQLGDSTRNGRMGDYVYNQEALDQIMTQLMDNSNSHRPVPAPDNISANLPREVLEEGSSTLLKDCAVCKDQFQLNTDDPDEQVVVTLPCQHPFHEPCILPWLKSSGTCPVCRYSLVPQPDQEGSPSPSGGSSSQPDNPPSTSPLARAGGILSALFGGSGQAEGSRSDSQWSGIPEPSQRRSSDDAPHPPGDWYGR